MDIEVLYKAAGVLATAAAGVAAMYYLAPFFNKWQAGYYSMSPEQRASYRERIPDNDIPKRLPRWPRFRRDPYTKPPQGIRP
jgi:hypothetical protein